MTTVKKIFKACMGTSSVSEQFGPFETAEEAEMHARRLGWNWVLAETRTLDEFGTILDVKQRYYSIRASMARQMTPELAQEILDLTEGARRQIMANLPKPMNPDEKRFFAEYEQQMLGTPICTECGEEIKFDDLYSCEITHFDGRPDETIHFHKDFKKLCALKWSNKRLEEANKKLTAILEMFNDKS